MCRGALLAPYDAYNYVQVFQALVVYHDSAMCHSPLEVFVTFFFRLIHFVRPYVSSTSS